MALQYRYGRFGSQAEELEISDDMMVVRTQKNLSFDRAASRTKTARQVLAQFEKTLALPDAGVTVLRTKRPTAGSAAELRDEARSRVRRLRDFRFAGRALKDPLTDEPVVYTENLFIKFMDDEASDRCEQVIHDNGLQIKRNVPFARNAYFVAADGKGLDIFGIANDLLERRDVEFCHPELVRERKNRTAHNRQWHLMRTLIDGQVIDAHANVREAWALTRGKGTTIAILDDGVDIDHPEFNVPGKVLAPFDATSGTSNPRPKDPMAIYGYFDDHGTACAGVACASGLFGASGVAPDAKLMPIRLSPNLGSMEEADAIAHAVNHGADVISCSWGPLDGDWRNPADPLHITPSPLPASTQLALEYAITHGRQRRGCVIVWAAGNGNESVELDGYAASPMVIAVAACNDQSQRSVYSDFGKSIWCTFPSNDFGYPPFCHPDPQTTGIWTTDRSGKFGYNPGRRFSWEPEPPGDDQGQYTATFGGTSSATPGVAGLVALLLSREPNLAWDEVRDRLRDACVPIDTQNGRYNANGHSPFYGYGRPNAVALLQPTPSAASSVGTPSQSPGNLQRHGIEVFASLTTKGTRHRAARNWKRMARSFSQFDPDHQNQVLWTQMGFHLAGDAASDSVVDKLAAVLDFAERRARVDDPEVVQHSLAVFATHNRLGRLLHKPRSAHVHPARLASPSPQADAQASHSEELLNYWREDPLANEHHEHWHQVYPGSGIEQFDRAANILGPMGWQTVISKFQASNGDGRSFILSLTSEEFRACFRLNDRHGQLFLYMHQQMLARYDAERMAVDLDPVKPFDLITGAIDVGYEPPPELKDSLGVSGRPPNTKLPEEHRAVLAGWFDTLHSALNSGAPIIGSSPTRTPLTIETLGRAIEAVDSRFTELVDLSGFGNLHNAGHNLISELSGGNGGVMGATSVAIRDPVFWRWHKLIDQLGADLLDRLPPYSYEDRPPVRFLRGMGDIGLVSRPDNPTADFGARIEAAVLALPSDADLPPSAIQVIDDVSVTMTDTLFTSFAERTAEIPGSTEADGLPGKATTLRYLRHHPFGYVFRVTLDRDHAMTCTFRIFIAPEHSFNDQRAWIEMDKFTRNLNPGVNGIYQSDDLSSVINKPAEDPITPTPSVQPHATPGPFCDCGWPYTLLLPRGDDEGIPYILAVIVTDTAIDLAETDHSCGSMSFCGATDRYPDTRELGYPFSRRFSRPLLDVLTEERHMQIRPFRIVHS